METLTTALAAERAGVDVAKFHRLVRKHGLEPAFEAPGLRGAKFWLPRDVDRLIELEASDEAVA